MRNYNLMTFFVGIIAVFVFGVVLLQLKVVLLPFVFALLLSIIFKPVVVWTKHNRVPTAVSLIGVMVVFLLVMCLMGWIVYASTATFIREIPRYDARVTEYLEALEAALANIAVRVGVDASEFYWGDAIDLSSLTSVLTTGVGSFISFLGTAFLVLLFMMFILAGSGDLAMKVKSAFPEAYASRIAGVVSNVDQQVRRYLITKTLVSLGTGLLTFVILLIVGVDFPLVWGFLAFILNYIPNFGSLTAVVFPTVLSLLQFQSPGVAVLVFVLLVGTQATMGNVIEPRIMGFSLNLSPLLILVSLIFWAWLWGVWGMVLAVPLTATVKIIFENVTALRPLSVLMSGWRDPESTLSSPR